jgi:hypothetical protein
MDWNGCERSGRIPPYSTLRQGHRVSVRDVNLVENMDQHLVPDGSECGFQDVSNVFASLTF